MSTKITLSIIILCSIFLSSCSQQWYEHGNPHFINQQDYEKLVIKPQTRNKGVTFLKFFTPWCRYCRYLKDIIDQLKAKQTWAITVYEVNCDSENYNWCKSMGVRSYPKMAIFQNGVFQESMDGFYPFPVVQQLFVKYNRTAHVDAPIPAVTVNTQPHKQQIKQPSLQQVNYVEPQVVVPDVKKDDNQLKNQQKTSQKQQVPLHHAEPEHQIAEEHKITEQVTPKAVEQPKHQQQKHVEPVKVKQFKPQPKQVSQPQKTVQPKPEKPKQPIQVTPPSQPKQPQTKNIKRSQQMIEQEQNIAIVDQDIKQTENQKKIAQEVQNGTLSSIDLTKLIPKEQDLHHYGKYMIYAICILVGGYYFANIMKADPHHEHVKPHQSHSDQSSSQKSSRSQIPPKISIQDSQMRQELNFEHPNEEEINFNSVQIRDQDL